MSSICRPQRVFRSRNFQCRPNLPRVWHRGLASSQDLPSYACLAPSSQDTYWRRIPQWSSISKDDFLSYKWQTKNTVRTAGQLLEFIRSVLPTRIPFSPRFDRQIPAVAASDTIDSDRFLEDVGSGIKNAPMAISLTPHILSLIDWQKPLADSLLRQFVPLASRFYPDHPKLTLDSLNETGDSPVPGLIHRYPDKAVFMSSSVCPVYCRFCTRSYTVGANTASVSKTHFLPIAKKWEPILNYIENTSDIVDVLVSGGDGYYLTPAQLSSIGQRLLSVPHVLRIRFASKGLSVCPSRMIDPADPWTTALIQLSNQGRKVGKSVALHTHFNNPNEITWVTDAAALRLFQAGVQVRNQSVLLNGVNSDAATMGTLIRRLAALNIQPYYVFQCDMVHGSEDLRTPLSTMLEVEQELRGSIAGFMTPNFIVNLPGGGGKRLACSFESYDRKTGRSTFRPMSRYRKGLARREDQGPWEYWDPLWSLSAEGREEVLRGVSEGGWKGGGREEPELDFRARESLCQAARN